MYRMQKKSKALFCCQKPSNFLQVVVTYTIFFVGFLSTGCKQCIFTKYNGVYTKKSHAAMYRKHCFWNQKPSNLLQVRITHNALSVVSLSTGTAILVRSNPMQQCTGCEKSQKHCCWYQTLSNWI